MQLSDSVLEQIKAMNITDLEARLLSLDVEYGRIRSEYIAVYRRLRERRKNG